MNSSHSAYLILAALKRVDCNAFQTAVHALHIAEALDTENSIFSAISNSKESPEVATAFKLAERCREVLYQDEPRFTEADLADGLCHLACITADDLTTLCSDRCSVELFDAIAISAAELYREKMRQDCESTIDNLDGHLASLRNL